MAIERKVYSSWAFNNECFEKDEIMHAVEDGFKNAEQINHEIEVLLLKIVMGGR